MSFSENCRICLENLIFDDQNPRLPVSLQGVTNESRVIDYMLKFGNIIELMLSIAETGYSDAEPLLVVKASKEKYMVVEGNRRLAALKLLNNPQIAKVREQSVKAAISGAKYRPTEIPCILYQNRSDILDYLGYRHITGVKDWGPLEKARYLDQLYQIHIKNTNSDAIYQKLAKMIGSRSDYVLKLHLAFKLYERANNEAYFGKKIKQEDISFSWITTALGYSGISAFLGLTDVSDASLSSLKTDHFEKIFVWMFDEDKAVIKESRQISDLAKIVEFPAAIEKLEKSRSIEEALLYTSAPNETFIEMLKKAKQHLKQALDALAQLNEEPLEASDLLEEIEKLTKTISGGLRSNFGEDDSDILKQLDPKTLAQLRKILENKE